MPTRVLHRVLFRPLPMRVVYRAGRAAVPVAVTSSVVARHNARQVSETPQICLPRFRCPSIQARSQRRVSHDITNKPASSMQSQTIAFIGGGNMASAIIGGLRREADKAPQRLVVCDVVPAIRERHAAGGLEVFQHAAEAAVQASVVVLAVKPQVVDTVLSDLKPVLTKEHLFVSICAGITTTQLQQGLGTGVRVIRAMPNTPVAVAQGMVGLCAGSNASDADMDLAETLFENAAQVLRIDESQMDALTAISGSGPAYVFHFCEAMQAAACDLGFTPDQAALLVGQTVGGSIAYLRSLDGFPAAELRQQVTSPGGTTAAALDVFAERGFPDMVKQAIRAARDRSQELAR